MPKIREGTKYPVMIFASLIGQVQDLPLPNLLKTQTYQNLTIAALDRLRVQQFGTDALKVFGMTPETGETELAEFTVNWGGHRVVATTESGTSETGAWQFQVKAEGDPAFMTKATSLKIGARRWKVKKVEAPMGNSLVWKIKAEVQ